jgi:hypothetical protein
MAVLFTAITKLWLHHLIPNLQVHISSTPPCPSIISLRFSNFSKSVNWHHQVQNHKTLYTTVPASLIN